MLFVLFVALPIIEIGVAVLVAHAIGLGWTLVALVALSLIGGWQIKVQGLEAWREAVTELDHGGSPALVVLEGALRVIGAVLLTLPGFLSALVGIVLLVRPSRRVVARQAGGRLVARLSPSFMVVTNRSSRSRGTGSEGMVDVEGWEERADTADGAGRNVLDRPGS